MKTFLAVLITVVLVLGCLALAVYLPAQLLAFALPYFGAHGIGLAGPAFLTAALEVIVSTGSYAMSAGSRKD